MKPSDMKGQPVKIGDTVVAGTMAGLITGEVVDIGFLRYEHRLAAKVAVTAIVGAYGEDAGAAYVFTRSGTVWTDWSYSPYVEDLMVINKQLDYFKETYPELQI